MARVLVVDDSKVVRQMIREELEKCGHIVAGEAGTGREAITLFRKEKPDLVTMDIIMDDIDGIDAIRKILTIDKKAKIIVISALEQESIVDELKRLGVVDYISKPFVPQELSMRLSEIL
jgi:two-component system chemotaxis response regulator CheY